MDKFFLIDDLNVSVRSWIARELVSNILVYREYSSAFPAKIIIGKDHIYVENWNRSNIHGRLDPENFMPQPKNPLLSRFFVNIGRADQLGSGIRNLYKYTKIYSSGEPELIEGDIFKTIIPLDMSKNRTVNIIADKFTHKVADNLPSREKAFPCFDKYEWITNAQAREYSGYSEGSVKRYLRILAEKKILLAQGEKKSRCYRLLI